MSFGTFVTPFQVTYLSGPRTLLPRVLQCFDLNANCSYDDYAGKGLRCRLPLPTTVASNSADAGEWRLVF
jgi:hypothetical protein